jgi:hypothetical protein
MVKYLVPASLLLSQSIAAASLFDSYVSFSFELIGFPTFAGELYLDHLHTFCEIKRTDTISVWAIGTKHQPNGFSHNLMRNLAELQGSGIVVRVGGNSGFV